MDTGTRLARVERTVETLRRKIDDSSSCIEILKSLSSVRIAVDKLATEIAVHHVEESFSEMVNDELRARLKRNSDQRQPIKDKVDDLALVIAQLLE